MLRSLTPPIPSLDSPPPPYQVSHSHFVHTYVTLLMVPASSFYHKPVRCAHRAADGRGAAPQRRTCRGTTTARLCVSAPRGGRVRFGVTTTRGDATRRRHFSRQISRQISRHVSRHVSAPPPLGASRPTLPGEVRGGGSRGGLSSSSSFLTQFRLLLGRSWREVSRSKLAIGIKAAQQVMIALIYGGIYSLGHSQSSIQDRFGLLSLVAIGHAPPTPHPTPKAKP